MNNKILIVGNGWLGNKIKEYLDCQLAPDMIQGFQDVERIIEEYKPEIIINAIGITGSPNIDWCESHQKETWFGNVEVPVMLAKACKDKGIRLVHMSSGCIYQGGKGDSGWAEEDKPNFEGSYYSHSKAETERLLADYPNILITRIRMPLDKEPGVRNLLSKLLKYNNIINLPNSLTVVDDYLAVLKGLIEQKQTGIFNCVNQGTLTHEELLSMYEEISGQKLNKTYVNDLDNVAAPRSNCILSTDKLLKLGLALPPVKVSARKQVEAYVQNEKLNN